MKMVNKYVADVKVLDVQKRRVPSKHYVYIIEVHWSDGSQSIIYRRYSKFFSLQTNLIDAFPEEGGVKDPANRIIPFLPGKIIFGRSHVREVALKRKDPIHEYCQSLIKLPKLVSECDLVLNFFYPTDDDLIEPDSESPKKALKTADVISDPVLLEQYIALADYKATSKNRVNLIAGDTVEVIEKHENGWWLVIIDDEQGWAPSSYLHPAIGGPDANVAEQFKSGEEPRYVCMADFTASQSDEISLDAGMIVDVCSKHADGWWLVRYKGKEGWAPRAHLKKTYSEDAASKRNQLRKVSQPRPIARKKNGVPAPPRRKTVRAKLDSDMRSRSQDKGEPIPSTNDPKFYSDLMNQESPAVEYVALSNYKLSVGNESVSLGEGAKIKVIEKAPNGWWYVKMGDNHEGWVPADIIEKRRKRSLYGDDDDDDDDQPDYENVVIPEDMLLTPTDSLINKFRDRGQSVDSMGASDAKEFITIGPYVSADKTGISFKENEIAIVLERNDTGWWFIQIGSEEGWAPSTFLRPHTGPQKITSDLSGSPSTNQIAVFLPPKKPERKQSDDNDYENLGNIGRPTAPIPSKKPQAKGNLSKRGTDKAPRPSPRQTTTLETNLVVNSEDVNKNKVISKLEDKKISQITAALQRTQKFEQSLIKKPAPMPRPKSSSPNPPAISAAKPNHVVNSRPARPPVPSKGKQLPKRPPPPNFATKERTQQKERGKAKKNMFVAIASYQDNDDEMLSFDKGQMIEVLDQDAGGWWFGIINDHAGWVPSNFLKEPTAG